MIWGWSAPARVMLGDDKQPDWKYAFHMQTNKFKTHTSATAFNSHTLSQYSLCPKLLQDQMPDNWGLPYLLDATDIIPICNLNLA